MPTPCPYPVVVMLILLPSLSIVKLVDLKLNVVDILFPVNSTLFIFIFFILPADVVSITSIFKF